MSEVARHIDALHLIDGLVGRDVELAELGRRLAAALGGNGSVVLAEGEPGMGKTALAHELTWRARREGIVTSWGACLEGEGAPAYRPWIQILRSLGLSAATLLAPEVDSRFQIFDEVCELLRAAAAGPGMLVVLDDLHWADVPSMRLLQVLASEVAGWRLLVLGLYRRSEIYPQAELARALGVVLRERGTSRLTLRGLAPVEVELLAARVLRHAVEPALVRAVAARAEGNPLFVVELVRLAASSELAGRPLPDEVREVIARRLDRLREPVRQLVRQAAVLGREFSLRVLAEVAVTPAAELVDLLDEAIVSELLAAGDGVSLRFAHVLTQEVAYGELPPGERQRLHLRAADAIGDAEHLADARAHHLRQAVALGGTGPAVGATLQAASRAVSQLAYEHAAFQYRHAVALVDDSATRSRLLLELARCEFRSGAVAEAWASCRAAADLGRAAGNAVTLAEAATVVRGLTNDPICAEIHALCREALAALGGADPVLRARLLGQLAVTADRWARGVEPGSSQRALLAAETTGDPDALFLALQARHADLIDCRYSPERLAVGERAVRLGQDTGRQDYLAWGHVWRLDALWELSRRVPMDAELAALTGVVAHMREPLSIWRLTMIRASLALFEGRFADASELADQAVAIGRRGGQQEADFYHIVFGSHLAPQVGDFDTLAKVEAFVRRFASEGHVLRRAWLARVLRGLGRVDEASATWNSLLPHLDAFPRYTPEWIINLTTNAEFCVLLDRWDLAGRTYADLLPFADRLATAGAHTASRGPVSLYLGQLATLIEDWDAADKHLATALHLATAMGSPPFEAAARVEIARLLLARRRPGDTARAEAHLEAAIHVTLDLGMWPLAAEASALLAARRGGRSTPLSPREEQIAALVAQGLSNRQVAGKLHLSERTVETHVRSIFNKLGFDSRARIASWFASLPPRD
jgi:DNA-binding CsgD family transcriptional regulator